jgi:hypothetical protein
MVFFAPLPEPEPLPDERPQFFRVPGQEPENALPGPAAFNVLLARSDTTAIGLSLLGAYPDGLALRLHARRHPDHVEPFDPRARYHRLGPLEDLRFGLEWPDGTRVEPEPGWPGVGSDVEPALRLSASGGGGGGLRFEWNLWLWPLPQSGPVLAHVLWERRGIAETSVQLDLTSAIAAAASAVELWPLPDPPAEFGWFAYSPLESARHIATPAPDVAGE